MSAANSTITQKSLETLPESSSVVLLVSAAVLGLLLSLATRYGYFRDELYYLACGEHLAWGYVDQPPLIAVIAWFARHVLGGSLFALRAIPAVAFAALVWLAGRLARELGGGRFAQLLAALCTFAAGVFLVMAHLFTMNAFEPLFWMGCAFLFIRIFRTGNQKLWIWFGVVAGLGLLTKYSMGFFGGALLVGMLLTPARRAFLNLYFWIGGASAFAIFLPNLLWLVSHHWPFLELMRNIRASGRDVRVSTLGFFGRQFLLLGPTTFPIWLVGLGALFFSRRTSAYRALGWAYVGTMALLFLEHGKDYYLAPAYPMLFAAGAVTWERWLARRTWLKPVLAVFVVSLAVPLMPLVLPVLSPSTFEAYARKLPFEIPRDEKSHYAVVLPQHFSDEFGWPEMVAEVARVWNSLPAEARAKTIIFCDNYGEAGAIDFFGPRYNLPHAYSGHQNYFFWGPPPADPENVIVLGENHPHDLEKDFEHVEKVGHVENAYALERFDVYFCSGIKFRLHEYWPQVKNWD